MCNPHIGRFCMGLIIDNTVFAAQEKNLKAALSTDPKLRKVIQGHIREALFEARRQVMQDFPGNDPRGAVRSVKTSVYEAILGGRISITGKPQGKGTSSYTPPRTLTPGQRGGNRRKRSQRTKQIQSYGPLDRGFILRFVNSGTKTRVIGFRNTVKANRAKYERRVSRISSGETSHTGNRGSIAPRNWFIRSAESALGTAAQNIMDMINIEVNAILNGDL